MLASSSNSNTGFSGFGALSHVYIQHPTLRCSVAGAKSLFYDDGNKLLVSPTTDQVFSWKTSPFSPTVSPTSDSVSEGPILSIRYSLDAKFSAIQRSIHEVQFWNRETGDTFVQRCKTESESILGFFWTDCSTCDDVFVKTSANSEKVKVHPSVYVLTIQLLARAERYAELGLFILNKILEPSKEVVFQLLESGRQHLQTRKLGLEMLRQLSLHDDYVVLLVQDEYYLEALRYVRKYKVNTVREAAFASNDTQHLAAVLRVFSDFVPGFKATSDYNTYIRVLAEMSSSIDAC